MLKLPFKKLDLGCERGDLALEDIVFNEDQVTFRLDNVDGILYFDELGRSNNNLCICEYIAEIIAEDFDDTVKCIGVWVVAFSCENAGNCSFGQVCRLCYLL